MGIGGTARKPAADRGRTAGGFTARRMAAIVRPMQKFMSRILCALILSVSTHVVLADDASTQNSQPTATGKVATLLDKGFAFLGVRYRMGGNGPDAGGFDCSGLVRKVFGDALGLNLPRTAAEMAQMGEKVASSDLKPGDLVFFNTMRRTFSHVGIYLGDNKFLHSPSKGSAVRVEDMTEAYWTKRFTGGRRLISEAQAAGADMAAQDSASQPPALLARPPEPGANP